MLSRMETRLDDNATKEFLQSLDESSYNAKNVKDGVDKDVRPLTKVEKNAMNEIVERAQFSHMPRQTTPPWWPSMRSSRRS